MKSFSFNEQKLQNVYGEYIHTFKSYTKNKHKENMYINHITSSSGNLYCYSIRQNIPTVNPMKYARVFLPLLCFAYTLSNRWTHVVCLHRFLDNSMELTQACDCPNVSKETRRIYIGKRNWCQSNLQHKLNMQNTARRCNCVLIH